MRVRMPLLVLVLSLFPSVALAQSVTVRRNVNLRPDPSTEFDAIRLLKPGEPPLTLLDPSPEFGYYHVKTAAGEEGFVWSRNVRVVASENVPADTVHLGSGVPGSSSMVGCGEGLWKHVYNPSRLLVLQDCLTVTGVLVDATANWAHPNSDGTRHEKDGDTHGWLKVDQKFAELINDGNTSKEDGNLVFEIVCHFKVSQTDAKPFCAGLHDTQVIPPVGTHVAITGTIVKEKNHGKWIEIHPVSKIVEQQ